MLASAMLQSDIAGLYVRATVLDGQSLTIVLNKRTFRPAKVGWFVLG
jgi:hypothetical protein